VGLPLPFELLPFELVPGTGFTWFLIDPHGVPHGPRKISGEALALLVAWVRVVNDEQQ
jgi:hypothetical protein